MEGKISVLMGIYNCADTLEEAVKSIQDQTYTNWEIIMCDDGSTDTTYQMAAELAEKDSRIRLIRNERNYGLNETLNRCLGAANGEYIARMDGDDKCVPERFERQLKFLERHPEFNIVSSPMILFDENGVWGITSAIEFPCSRDIVTGNPICHAPAMMRKSCLDAVGGYTVGKRVLRVEDIDLWIKLYAAGYKCYNFQEPLYMMRNDQNALNRRKYRYRVNSVYVRLKGCRLLHLGPECYMEAVKPMVIGLVPAKLRYMIRRKQRGK